MKLTKAERKQMTAEMTARARAWGMGTIIPNVSKRSWQIWREVFLRFSSADDIETAMSWLILAEAVRIGALP